MRALAEHANASSAPYTLPRRNHPKRSAAPPAVIHDMRAGADAPPQPIPPHALSYPISPHPIPQAPCTEGRLDSAVNVLADSFLFPGALNTFPTATKSVLEFLSSAVSDPLMTYDPKDSTKRLPQTQSSSKQASPAIFTQSKRPISSHPIPSHLIHLLFNSSLTTQYATGRTTDVLHLWRGRPRREPHSY